MANTLEALNKSLEEARKEMLKEKEQDIKKEDTKEPEKEKAGLKSENNKEEKPYTIEDLRKLKEEKGEKAFENIDEKKLEPELIEKYKLLQGMATKRQQFISAKEKELDKLLEERKNSIKELNEIKNGLKDKIKEISEYDDEFKELYNKLGKIDKEIEKYNAEEAAVNWQNAEIAVREQFPEFGIFSEKELTETLKENKRLLELAMIDNGRFGDIVLGAAHILTMLKQDNFKKIILAELTNKPEVYKDIIDILIKKEIEAYEKKQEKKKSFSELTEKRETESQEIISPNNKKKAKESIADMLKNAAFKIMKEAE